MQILNNEQDRSRLGTERAASVRAGERLTEPRFTRSSIFDDISEAIAKVRKWLVVQIVVPACTFR
jgi:hypothetical protein